MVTRARLNRYMYNWWFHIRETTSCGEHGLTSLTIHSCPNVLTEQIESEHLIITGF